ncbi:MAG: hypothetical protein GWN99_09645 [Gemmatimonadetes bacterium]|uniref:Uncharacterized protein n=1 Tax=Candidatus Kutchimonas denitrificans TaxID=3056748 RepID=A0AAE5CB83_9BACT|nr:hypothetical protein [Gemmatimonadota bacterium]NIR74130.1 hypothetical protein [Candidatus Kutchimonas denitrificans]NIS01312.1 hypothetical protein [Gemmatimonadota bacterium]NIT67043.1 hypothetical protein [Gemmatimonadota bacterium]NIU51703.1 hypothetical protein [Gemmatimonadota bacterium]
MRSEGRGALYAAAVGVVAVVVYANSLANGFAYDDEWIIQGRELVHGLDRVWQVLVAPYWPEGFGSPIYRPLTLLSFALDWQIWGGAPFGFHLTNVLLHALASILVTLFLFRFFSVGAAVMGGLVFAVHSVHTEAVANVVGRAELLATGFVLLGCLVYMRAVRGERFGTATVFLLAALYALAASAKEVAFVMPALLLVTDAPIIADLPREDRARFVRQRLPTFVVLAAVLVALLLARWAVLGTPVGSGPARVFAADDSFSTRLFTMARVWPLYFELLVFPLDLSADYSPAVILPATGLTPMGVVGFVLVLGILALAVAAVRRAPEFAMAVAWAAVTLAPVSNLLFTAETVLGERRVYLTSVAVSIPVGLMIARSAAVRRRWLTVAVGVWAVLFAVVTVRRNPVWESTDSVFASLLTTHPESSRALFALGLRHHELGNEEEAREWLSRSLEIWPWYAPYQVRYALVLIEQGELARAEKRAWSAIELDPYRLDHHKLLVSILLMDGRPEEAIAKIRHALLYASPDASLYTQLADARAAVGDAAGAARAQRSAIEAGRDDAGAWLRLAGFRAAAGDTAAALSALDSVGGDRTVADSLAAVWEGGN